MMRWKTFQWIKFLFSHSSNYSRKLSRPKFHNELACVFTAHFASKDADWNQQQLMDGGILANWNSANHPYFFLSSQKEVQILAFSHVICERIISCPPPENRNYSDKGRGNDFGVAFSLLISWAKLLFMSDKQGYTSVQTWFYLESCDAYVCVA